MATDRNDGGVDHGIFHVGIIRQHMENPLKNACFGPVIEALEHREPTIVAPAAARSARLAKTMRRDLLTLGVR